MIRKLHIASSASRVLFSSYLLQPFPVHPEEIPLYGSLAPEAKRSQNSSSGIDPDYDIDVMYPLVIIVQETESKGPVSRFGPAENESLEDKGPIIAADLGRTLDWVRNKA